MKQHLQHVTFVWDEHLRTEFMTISKSISMDTLSYREYVLSIRDIEGLIRI